MQQPRTEFAQALRAIAAERGLEADVILDTIKQAIIAAYKRDAREVGIDTESFGYDVEIDPKTGEAKVFSWPLPPDREEGEEDLSDERLVAPKDKKDVTPPGFGRIAAQTAKQVIHQKIREAEKGAIMGEYEGRVGTLISGMILRFDGSDARVDLGRTEGVMPQTERVPNERLSLNQRLSFLLKEIKDTLKGKQIVLSRSDADFVKKLFEREVPEISSGSVEINSIAREAGVRTKMTVSSNQSGVDPVGSCVGQKGVRVQAVTNELGGERVDIIQYTDDTAELIKASLAPAENLSVKLDEKTKTAVVKAPEDQLSLAIGRDGQNARLSAKLTNWKIEIKAAPVAKAKTEEKKKVEKVEQVDKVEEETEPESELGKVEKNEAVGQDSVKPTTQADDTKNEDKKNRNKPKSELKKMEKKNSNSGEAIDRD